MARSPHGPFLNLCISNMCRFQGPRMILDRHWLMTLCVDCMVFVNGVLFLVSMTRWLNFITTKHTPSQTMKNLAVEISHTMELYACGGFQVGTVLKYDCSKRTCSTQEIKCQIRHMKEGGTSILNTLHIVLWLNLFPMKSGVSQTLLSWEIVVHHKLDLGEPKLYLEAIVKPWQKPAKQTTLWQDPTQQSCWDQLVTSKIVHHSNSWV